MPDSAHRISIELFAYPWDIVDRGAREFVAECRDLGITKVHVTILYHSGKFFLPRNTANHVYFPQPGAAYIPLSQGDFQSEMAPPEAALAASDWLDDIAGFASDSDLSLAAWTVFQHNSTLGQRNPQFTVRNLFHDSYPYALCPSRPEVQRYSLALAKAICSKGVFGTLDLESIGYLGYVHGYHHEVTAVPMGPLEHFLLSLCFCDACETAMKEVEISVERLRADLQRVLLNKVRRDDAASRHPDNIEQVAALLVDMPHLQRLVRLRLDTVTALVKQIRSAIGSVELSVFTSSFVGSPANIWMEGVALKELGDTVNEYQLLAYSPDSDVVNGDLVFCLSLVDEPSKLNLTLNLGLPITPSLDDALTKVDFARRQGVRRFSFFNYGFLGAERLRWIKQISEMLCSGR